MEFQSQLKISFLTTEKNNLCLLCVRSEDKHLYKRVYEAISLKETFWLLLRIWAKVTRPAGRNKGQEYKAFEWN